MDIDDYFSGPRDMQKHSKLPYFMRVHGSVLPKMILPLTFVGVWCTAIQCIHVFVSPIAVDTVLLTVLGFVVAFGVSFRCSTGYERYNEGRKYWSQLTLSSRNLARIVWLNIPERESEENPNLSKQDLLGKLSAIQLINAFAIALKHRLRFEPATNFPDLHSFIAPLHGTVADKIDQEKLHHKIPSKMKRLGEHLGVTFAQSNPRKLLKRANENLGNLPNEILTHLSAYIEKSIQEDKNIPTVCAQNLAYTDIRIMSDILSGTERILNTPIPLAYSISISQITWAYIIVLPFQLVNKLDWVSIPATMVAAYIILGLAMIGREIENPFGDDVNDLPLEHYCAEISSDLDVLTATPWADYQKFLTSEENRPLYPLSFATTFQWEAQNVEDIRDALRAKAAAPKKMLERSKTMVAPSLESA